MSQVTATGNSRALGSRKRERMCCRLAFDFSGNLLKPTAQGCEIAFALLLARFVAAQIEHQLRVILAFQLS